MYEVRTRNYESRKWKTCTTFATKLNADKFAIKLDLATRTNSEIEHIEVKNTFTGERYTIR